MDNKKKLLAGSAMVALSTLAAQGAMADNATLNMSAEIIEAVAVIEETPLNFGVLTVAGSSGNVTITPSNTVSTTGGVTSISNGARGQIKITGDSGRWVDISLPTSDAVSLTSGVDTMSVTGFNINTDGGGNAEAMTIAGGSMVVDIGATLNVNNGQAVGIYQGEVTVTVTYQ